MPLFRHFALSWRVHDRGPPFSSYDRIPQSTKECKHYFHKNYKIYSFPRTSRPAVPSRPSIAGNSHRLPPVVFMSHHRNSARTNAIPAPTQRAAASPAKGPKIHVSSSSNPRPPSSGRMGSKLNPPSAR